MTSRNIKGIDLLVSNANGSATVTVQVKTSTGDSFPVFYYTKDIIDEDSAWKRLREVIAPGDNKLFAFVRLKGNEVVTYYVVPSSAVEEVVRSDITHYLQVKDGVITKMAQREKKKNGKVVLKKGQRLSWASMGNVAVPENKLVGFEKDKGIDEIKRRLG